jgi:putative ABC transport system permease protein
VRALRASVYGDDIAGDLPESYRAVADRHSLLYARWWYRVHAARLAARYAVRLRPTFKSCHAMDRFAVDLRYALRSLAKRRLMSAAVVVTLALGIGANAAVFGVIDALVLRPFTIRDVDRIVMPVATSPTSIGRRESVSPADFLDWRRDLANGTIDHLSAMQWWDVNLVGRDEPERVLGFFVSHEFFAALSVQPALGRTFVADDEIAGNNTRVLLSDRLWKRRFGADPAIVGKPILADGTQSIVVGVMPPEFDFPMAAEMWAPLSFDDNTAKSRSSRSLTVIGRLADGRRLSDAQAQMSVIAERLERQYPDTNRQRGIHVYTLSGGMIDIGLPPLMSLWQAAAGLFVLLIACANIANLLLARGAERGREVAIRLALGSSRGRIIRESLLESGLLGLAAAPLAIGIAWIFLLLMRAFMPGRVIRFIAGWNQLTIDGRLVAVTIALGMIAAIVFGTIPALQTAPGDVSEALKTDGRTGSGPGRQRLRRGLVIAEIALCVAAARRRDAQHQQRAALPDELAGLRSRERADAADRVAQRAVPRRREPSPVRRLGARGVARRAECERRRRSATSSPRSIRIPAAASKSPISLRPIRQSCRPSTTGPSVPRTSACCGCRSSPAARSRTATSRRRNRSRSSVNPWRASSGRRAASWAASSASDKVPG